MRNMEATRNESGYQKYHGKSMKMYPDPGYTGYIVLKPGYNRGTNGVHADYKFVFVRILNLSLFDSCSENELSVYK